jgi:alkylated DNA nucleotide flippase Atl1
MRVAPISLAPRGDLASLVLVGVLGGIASGLAPLLKLVARSRDWYERILAGEVATIGQLAQKCGLTRRYVRKILQVCKHIATNHRDIGNGQTSAQPDGQRTPRSQPLDWREQKQKILGQP